MSEIKLETKLVGNISGDFFVADYQRGYRWKEEVEMLLNDISEVEEGKSYCLQPIVGTPAWVHFDLPWVHLHPR